MRTITRYRRPLALLFAGLGLFGVAMAGCNTIEGAGEDVTAVGEEIDETAEDAN